MTDDPADDTVGYGRPPTATRFQPGWSGNPKGRRPKLKQQTVDVVGILDEPITVTPSSSASTANGKLSWSDGSARAGGAPSP